MRIAVAIPCYKVTQHVLRVIAAIGSEVEAIYAVDDACPDGSGRFIEENNHDSRVRVLYHPHNLGVGGAIVTAYKAAIADGMDIVVKIDGDGQMNPALLPHFISPLLYGEADYTKGNRFFRPESVQSMPPVRLFGNAVLSFLTKLSCGYWNTMDPTNGYTAVRTCVLAELPLDKLEQRYFFETDMLFRLNTVRAVVRDVPMDAVYADEESHLKVSKVLPEFLRKHASRLWRRYVYSYLVRDFNVGSVYSLVGLVLLVFGLCFGLYGWISGVRHAAPATSGTVMLAALPIIISIQCWIAFLHHDVSNVPTIPLSRLLDQVEKPAGISVSMPNTNTNNERVQLHDSDWS